MSKGYWVVSITVTDEAPYRQYVAANATIFDKWGGRFIVRGGTFETKLGAAGARQVVIEFESYDAAVGCYNSEDYQGALKLLLAGATVAQLVIVEGVP
ncbi:MAG: DUF1330 domain-containing protein [Devosia sp.]